MALFESILTLMLIAIVLLQVSRRMAIPYPTMLAMAGVAVAVLPWAPDIGIDPHLALALLVAPALVDAAFDFPARALRRYWLPLIALAAVAVVLTTIAVAWVGIVWGGLPIAAAIALGAIVSPPDAAAATAVLARFKLPRSTVTVLKGESLLNDAVALLIFGAAVIVVSAEKAPTHVLPQLALAVPGGLVLGVVMAKLQGFIAPRLVGTLGGILFQFVATFGVWLIANRLQVSAILTMVAYAMVLARYSPERTPARDRVSAYSVWDTLVFVLNVLAFLLVGLQARAIVTALDPAQLRHAIAFAGIVLGVVILVRIVWVLIYNRAVGPVYRWLGRGNDRPGFKQGIVAAWCGMRGLVTLATALALPATFPGRDLIVLSALGVVLGTLIAQGLTLGPLIRLLNFAPDQSFEREVAAARVAMIDAALASLDGNYDHAANALRGTYMAQRNVAANGGDPHAAVEIDELRRQGVVAQRMKLAALRRSGQIDDDVFHMLEQELDWAELAVLPTQRSELIEG